MAGYDPYSANNPLKPRARGQFAPIPQPEPTAPPSQDGYPSGFARRAATVSRPDGSRVAAQTGALIQPVDGMVERPPTYAPAPNPDVPLAQPGGYMPQYVQDLQPRGRPSGFSAAPVVSTALRPPADPNALPEGVTRRTDNFFEGKGTHGEPVYSDTAFAPQFAGVAGATGADQERFKNGYAGARDYANGGKSNMATEANAYEMARKAELERAGADYKAYVAAGSPRTKDGRGLTEYDFLQNQRQVGLEGFLDSNAGGEGSRQSDRTGLFGRRGGSNDPKRDPQQADQIAAVEAQQNAALKDVDINSAVNKRADASLADITKKYEANPGLARQWGKDVTPKEAADAEVAFGIVQSLDDPLQTEAGRRGVAVLERIYANTNQNRALFQGEDGAFPSGSKAGALENYGVEKRSAGQRFINKIVGGPDYVVQSPAFDKRDGKRNVPIDPNDPNAERYTNYTNELPPMLGGSRGQDFLMRYQEVARRRNKQE